MNKAILFAFGTLSYLVGLAGLSAFMLYMGGWSFLPIHINSHPASANLSAAIVINLLIIGLFGLHHSLAAREGFKQKLANYLPPEIERSLYVLVSGVFMAVFCLYWQPLPGTVWQVYNESFYYLLKTLHILGWVILVAATFEIDHFHLMGVKQSFSMNPGEGGELKENFLYRIVRHPIQTGVLLGIWATPIMSSTQLMLSICLTAYMFVGLYFEEKSLVTHFGEDYLSYKRRVPAVIPFWPTQK